MPKVEINEIINVLIGETGLKIGKEIFNQLEMLRHSYFSSNGINDFNIKNWGKIYNFEEDGNARLRAIYIDEEDKIFHDNNCIQFINNIGQKNISNLPIPIFTSSFEGMSSSPSTLITKEHILDNLRNALEKSENPEGFAIYLPAFTNVGYFLGLTVQNILEEFYPKMLKLCVPIYDTSISNDILLGLLNEINSTVWLNKYASAILPFDKFIILNKIKKVARNSQTNLIDENSIIADVMVMLIRNLIKC